MRPRGTYLIAKELIKAARFPSLIIHRQPDGDAIGSAASLLPALPPSSSLVCVSAIPTVFSWATAGIKLHRTIPAQTDLLIVLDCSEFHRTGLESAIKKYAHQGGRIVVIDHHAQNNLASLAHCYLHEPTAAATTEIIAELLAVLRAPITPIIAQNLLLGLYTDTGGFRFANTTSQTLRLVSRLVSLGADLNTLSQRFAPKSSLTKLKLWGAVCSQVAINRYGFATAIVRADDFARSGSCLEEVDGLVSNLLLLEGVKISLVLIETPDGWQGRLRTQASDVDLSRLAKFFGGEGRKNAAGFTVTTDLFSGKLALEC